MEDIKSQFSEVKSVWEIVYKNALGNPQLWKPHLPNASLEMLNEAVDTVSIWLERSKAPNGLSPVYQLAKSVAAIYLPSLLSAAQQLETGSYSHFQNFVGYLISTLAAIHTMAVYTPKNNQESINADFSAELSQALSLLNTAQRELSEKLVTLGKSQILAEEITKSHEAIKVTEEEIEAYKIRVVEYETQANSCLQNVNTSSEEVIRIHQEYNETIENNQREFESQIKEQTGSYEKILNVHKEKHDVLLANSNKLYDELMEMSDELSRLQDKCKDQEKIIDSILPRGASAGLAAAFSQRGKQLDTAKWAWLFAFVGSLIGLSAFAWHLVGMEVPVGTTFWDQLLSRLPLAAPMVWLGWFSAIQYGNIIRVQEDYAFKEATSKAYQGYKDHMEHLGNVNLDEGKTALALLSEATINVLSREPLRIYGKTEQDASPTHSVMRFLGRSHQKSVDETTGSNASK